MKQECTMLSTSSAISFVEPINGYVTAMYDGFWWLGYVRDSAEPEINRWDCETEEVEVNFLHPSGPSR